MINDSSRQKWDRLVSKQLSQQFLNEVREGLNCSPFEAQALLEAVERVYGTYFDTNGSLKPGQMSVVVVSDTAAPQLPLQQCPMTTVVLTLDGAEDVEVRRQYGVEGLRRHRLQRLCVEAHQQGGLLTLEDLAYRLLNSSPRTLSRDLAQLRRAGIILPLRSTIKDMGRSVTHRRLIVQRWLQGQSYTEIARQAHHSTEAVASYVEKFKRVYALHLEGMDVTTIAFLVRLSAALVSQYLELGQGEIVGARREELQRYLKKTANSIRRSAPKSSKPRQKPRGGTRQ